MSDKCELQCGDTTNTAACRNQQKHLRFNDHRLKSNMYIDDCLDERFQRVLVHEMDRLKGID